MPEWSNGADSKSAVLLTRDPGFESLSLRKFSLFVWPIRSNDVFAALFTNAN